MKELLKIAAFSMIWFSLAFTQDLIQNATFTGIYDEPIKLSNGIYEGERIEAGSATRPRVELVNRLIRRGDLDADGQEETIVLLTENSGGSGQFVYLAVLKEEASNVVNVATTLLGDRVQVRGMIIASSQIWIDLVVQGDNDGACCPTEKTSMILELQNNELVSVEADTEGNLSIADIEGIEWHLSEIDMGHPGLEDTSVTLTLNENRIAGNAGCNNYHSAYSSTDYPDALNVEPILATRKACPPLIMAQEHEFLTKLEHVTGFSYYFGYLALQYAVNDTYGQMLFSHD